RRERLDFGAAEIDSDSHLPPNCRVHFLAAKRPRRRGQYIDSERTTRRLVRSRGLRSTLGRSGKRVNDLAGARVVQLLAGLMLNSGGIVLQLTNVLARSEEHTSELQSR